MHFMKSKILIFASVEPEVSLLLNVKPRPVYYLNQMGAAAVMSKDYSSLLNRTWRLRLS